MLLIVIAGSALCVNFITVETGSHHGQQQVDKRQRLELISQAAPSTSLREARENIETELVQQPSKKNLGRIAPRPPNSILADLSYTN